MAENNNPGLQSCRSRLIRRCRSGGSTGSIRRANYLIVREEDIDRLFLQRAARPER